MSKKEVNRIEILEKARQQKVNNQEEAAILDISERQFRRLKQKYNQLGVAGIVHQARGKPSNRALPQTLKDYAISIIQERYSDFAPTLAHERLVEQHNITFSVETLRQEMIKAGIWEPKLRKRSNIHQLRERRACEGELVQVDGSPHNWLEGRASGCDLLVYIDDATGKLLWLKFVESESTEAYFQATREYLLLHGRPLSFYVDKHSVFRVNTTKADSASVTDSNGQTQFGRAMEELDIELIFANTPQAKGRVERVNQTLQDRLVKELRLAGINTMEAANQYLPKFIQMFNSRFAVEPRNKRNAHRPLLREHNLAEILCFKELRVVSKNLTLQYKNKTYRLTIEPRYEYSMRKARVTVQETVTGEVSINYKGKSLGYSVIEVTGLTRECDSKHINKRVDQIKFKQGVQLQFNLLGGTFLFWRKPDISNLG